jgi:hypothetical protein
MISTNDSEDRTSGDLPSSIIYETNSGRAAEMGDPPAAPMTLSERRDANAETSTAGAHFSSENGSAALDSSQIDH